MCYNDRAAGAHRATFGHFLTHRLHHFLSSYCNYVIQYCRPHFSSGKFHSVYEHRHVWNQHIFEKTRHTEFTTGVPFSVHCYSYILFSLWIFCDLQHPLKLLRSLSVVTSNNDLIVLSSQWFHPGHGEMRFSSGKCASREVFNNVDCCIMEIAGSNDFWKKLGTNIFKVP